MIRAYLVGDKEAVSKMRSSDSSVRQALWKEMQRIVIELQNKVKEEKLSGQVLNVRTDRLRGSIAQKVENQGQSIVGIVGTNVGYAGVHEFGGTVTVREHLRSITQAFGRNIAPITVMVSEHLATYPERSFLRSALSEMMPTIRERLQAAAVEGIKGSK